MVFRFVDGEEHTNELNLVGREGEMMTEEEWKVFEDVAGWLAPKVGCGGSFEFPRKDGEAILAAYRELKERREDEEWLHKNHAAFGYARPDTTFAPGRLHLKVGDTYHAFPEGTSLHAAITAARGK